MGFQWPRRSGIQVDAWRLAEPARRQRETTLQQLAGRVAVGESLLLLCHCRRRGRPVQAGNLCHGDGIAAELLWRAAAQVAGAAGPKNDVTAETGEPLAPERACAADGGVGERCGAARLDEASDLRDALPNGARTVGCGGTGATFAGTGGHNGTGEATGAAGPRRLVAGGAGEKRKGGEANGEAEATTSMGKRPRGDKGIQKKGKQRAAKRKQHAGQQ